MKRFSLAPLALVALFGASSSSIAHAGASDSPPADLLSSAEADTATLDRVFASFRSVQNFEASFHEEKKLTLLAKPLRSEGVVYFERTRGLARHTKAPKPQKVLLTESTLKVWNGTTTEDVKLDQSRELSALALSFPRVLRGDRAGLANTFTLKLQGTDSGFWALTLVPKDASLLRMLNTITVVGERDGVRSITVVESNGDKSTTTFTDVRKNVTKPTADIEALFRLP